MILTYTIWERILLVWYIHFKSRPYIQNINIPFWQRQTAATFLLPPKPIHIPPMFDWLWRHHLPMPDTYLRMAGTLLIQPEYLHTIVATLASLIFQDNNTSWPRAPFRVINHNPIWRLAYRLLKWNIGVRSRVRNNKKKNKMANFLEWYLSRIWKDGYFF